jgi:hypothetical protein
MNEETPNYYAILTSDVRYDPILPPNAKLLYAEITALSNKRGRCWASNAYFAKLYNVTNRAIQQWIALLADRGYVKVTMDATNRKRTIELINKPMHLLR